MKPLDYKKVITVSRPKNDEVDLTQALFFVLKTIHKHRIAIFLIFFAIIGTGLVIFTMKPNRYTGAFICRVPFVKQAEMEEMIESIDRYVRERNVAGLENEFGFDRVAIEALKDVKLVITKDENDQSFLSKVEATVTSPDKFVPVQTQLVNTFKREINDLVEAARIVHQSKLAVIDVEIKRIDEVLKFAPKSAAIGTSYENIAALFKLKTDLEKERIEITNSGKQLGQIAIIQNFPKYTTASNKRYLRFFVLLAAFSFAVSIAYVLIYELNHMFREANSHPKEAGIGELNGWRNLNVTENGKTDHPQKLENVG
jgi:hypothetical protein